MATSTVDVQLIYDNFTSYGEAIQRELDIISEQAAERTIADYRRDAREDTGAQKASAYITGNGLSTYNEAVNTARQLNPRAEFFQEEQPSNEHAVIAGVAITYSSINEYGGNNRQGDGAFTRAVQANRQWFIEEVEKII